MADDVTTPAGTPPKESTAAAAAPPVAELLPTRRERARTSSYRMRFAIIYVLLAAAVGAAAGTFIVLVSRPGPAPAAQWSAWEPTGSADAMTKQIADHVSKRYRLPSDNQLAVAVVGPPEVQNVTVRAIAVRPDTSRGQAEEDDIAVVDAAKSVMYILCGLGERCSIPEGKPTEARHQLLRREALELSLYTFKYVDDIDSVIVFLPPRPADEVGTSVFLQKNEVKEELGLPLARTLTKANPPALGAMDPVELGNVDRLTRPRVFEYAFQQAQEGSAILVLTPIVLGT